MYKVGDYVRIVDKQDRHYNKIGKIIIIEGLEYGIEFIHDSTFGFNTKDFIPFIPFRPGDTVRIISTLKERDFNSINESNDTEDYRDESCIREDHLEYAGKIFTLTLNNFSNPIDGYMYWVLYNNYYWSPDLLELVKKSTQINIF